MKHIRLYSDKQLVSALRVLDPFNWDLWVKFHNISQIPSSDPSQEGILELSNPLSEKDLAAPRI